MAYPRFQRARAFRTLSYAGADISLNQSNITDLLAAGALDLQIEAQVDDVIEYGLNAYVAATAEHVAFDVYTVVAGAPVNPFGMGLSNGLAGNAGVPGWYCENVAEVRLLTGPIHRTMVAGDLETGKVKVRPRYAKVNTNARVIPTSARGLYLYAKNLGPADPE